MSLSDHRGGDPISADRLRETDPRSSWSRKATAPGDAGAWPRTPTLGSPPGWRHHPPVRRRLKTAEALHRATASACA
eukprot:7384560-Prymnesium_polylepis.2